MKHMICVVDANHQHTEMLVATLRGSYAVRRFDAPANALAGLHLAKPKLILIGQKVGSGTGINFLRDLRKEMFLKDIPVLFILDSEDFRVIDQLRELGVRQYLVKPYHRQALLNLIAKRLNQELEQSWQDLSTPQRKALEGALTAFNSLTEDIAQGNPLPMGEVNEACSALVEILARNDLGIFLSKIRDHDNFTFVHSLRFSALMALFGQAIGLPRPLQLQVASGGLLHDIGMLTIPKLLLTKSERLSHGEMELIRGHVAAGARILAATGSVAKGVTTIVTQHHERLDGSGYPAGLRSVDLNELAQMAGIIDIFCALTDRRSYRRAVAPHVAMEMMATEMKAQINVGLLVKFREILLDSTLPQTAEAEALEL